MQFKVRSPKILQTSWWENIEAKIKAKKQLSKKVLQRLIISIIDYYWKLIIMLRIVLTNWFLLLTIKCQK